jgi:pilus assembly protein Flp/PilA
LRATAQGGRFKARAKVALFLGNLIMRGEEMIKKLGQFAKDFLAKEDGPTAVEYAVMLALIIVVCIGAITTLGSNANKTFTCVGTTIASAS